KDAQKDYDWVRMSTNETTARSLNRIVESMDAFIGKPKPASRVLVVFNPLAWKRSGTVVAHIPGYNGFTMDDLVTKEHFTSYGITPLREIDPEKDTYDYEIPVRDVPALGFKIF